MLAWSGFLLAMSSIVACREPPPKAPGPPIVADPPIELRAMNEECDAMVAALQTWAACPNLNDRERESVEAWIERANEDFAAGRKIELDADSQRAIAAACHRATRTIGAATERCSAGKTPEFSDQY
jgi:hypothetical protein